MVKCTFHKDAVELLLSKKHRSLLEEFASKVESDPRFLLYHHLSTTTTLRRELLYDSVGPSGAPHCFDDPVGDCRVVEALKEALRQYFAERENSALKGAGRKGHDTALSGEQSD